MTFGVVSLLVTGFIVEGIPLHFQWSWQRSSVTILEMKDARNDSLDFRHFVGGDFATIKLSVLMVLNWIRLVIHFGRYYLAETLNPR
jgi:hypothetical protein